MAPVPKPADARQRRRDVAGNPVHRLPMSGRPGPAPKAPVELGPDGQRWWRWAWSTPQACGWHGGFTESLVKRAQLEDRFALTASDGDEQAIARVLALIYRFDDALGLTPAGAQKLHLTFVEDEPEPVVPDGAGPKVTPIRGRLKGMRE